MPPRQKIEVKPDVVHVKSAYEPEVGDFVHVVTRSGAKYKSAEILYVGSNGITIRTDLNGPTLAEVSFIPIGAIDGVGLIGKR